MKDYEKAKAAHDAAFYAFDSMRKLYRERKIGDDEFLAAREVYDQATKQFDSAFEKACNQ